jgi:hypothetical protein
MTDIKESRYLTREQAAEYLTNELGLITSTHTLAKLIVKGEGPNSYVYGKRRRLYNIDDLTAWATSRLHKDTAMGV